MKMFSIEEKRWYTGVGEDSKESLCCFRKLICSHTFSRELVLISIIKRNNIQTHDFCQLSHGTVLYSAYWISEVW